MATKSITTPSTLIEELVERTRLSSLQATAAVGLVLLLLLVGAAYLNGVLARPYGDSWWDTVRRVVWHKVDKPVIRAFPLSAYKVPGTSEPRFSCLDKPFAMIFLAKDTL